MAAHRLHTAFPAERVWLAAQSKQRPAVWGMLRGQVEFPPTVEAHAVCAAFDGEDAAKVTMPAAKDELEDRQWLHNSCARWRRSQLPLASNHSSSERTLARARAIAQSAAP